MLYILDEPTTGLHFDDIAKLLAAFRKLLAAGHTLLVIEHNLDVHQDGRLGPRSGAGGRRAGGYLVAAGTPEQIATVDASYHRRAPAAGACRRAGSMSIAFVGTEP